MQTRSRHKVSTAAPPQKCAKPPRSHFRDAASRASKKDYSKGLIPRRSLLSIAAPLPLGFLPVAGCDQGGNYSTGVTSNCVQLYQPAAAAEKRLREQMRPPPTPSMPTLDKAGVEAIADEGSSSDSSSDSSSSSDEETDGISN
mmetsp:Transcript_12417/g.34855  ORF Transcript_12417/g.34855 Transcript_12417/m.34855 type:complete len:143 (+) Transcript_12417:96-524(+)